MRRPVHYSSTRTSSTIIRHVFLRRLYDSVGSNGMTEAELEDLLSTPRPETEAALAACPGDVVILGAGGKMGPTLAHMAARAAGGNRRVIAVSRWTSDGTERSLNEAGVETVRADLLDR